jgi:hypothetical protein
MRFSGPLALPFAATGALLFAAHPLENSTAAIIVHLMHEI